MAPPSPYYIRFNQFRQIECGSISNYMSTCSSNYLAWPPFIARRHRHSLPCDP